MSFENTSFLKQQSSMTNLQLIASGMGLAVAQPSSIEGRLAHPSSRPQRRAWRRSCIFHRIIITLSPNQYRLLRFSSLSIRTGV